MAREFQSIIREREPALFLLGLMILAGAGLSVFHNYLLFHSLTEIFSVIVACGIFMLFWNARGFLSNGYFLFLGIAYFFVGGLDTLHTLSYKGMGVFPTYSADLPTQLWIASRYLESIALLIAPLFVHRRPKHNTLLVGYTGITALLLGSIFYWDLFPCCFVEGMGLTPFKRVSEYLISLILVASIVLLFQRRRAFDKNVFWLLVASTVTTIGSELTFTFYSDIYGFVNMVGHVLKIVSFYFIYVAFIEGGLTKPYNLLFRNLKQSERRYQTILETTGTAMAIVEEDTTISFVNAEFEKLSGYPREELEGKKSWTAFAEADDLARMRKYHDLRRIDPDAAPKTYEFQFVDREGEIKDVLLSIDMIPGSKKSVASLLDVTERKRAERAFQESENRLRQVIENMPMMMDAFDEEGVILAWNQECERVTGYSADEMVGDPDALERLYPDDAYRERMMAELRERGHNFCDWEWDLTCKDGTVRTVAWSNISDRVPIPGWDAWAIGMDVTERKWAQEMLEQYAEDLARSNTELQQFAYAASHDLQEPLRMVSSFLQLLQKRYSDQLDDKADMFIDYAVDGAERMKDMIDALLDLSRVATQGEEFAPTDSEAVLERTLSALQLTIEESGAEITHDPLPTVMADRGQLARVFQNLISNAIKFRDDARPRIHVSAERNEHAWVFSVRDNGIGLPPKHADRIFRIFQRLHTPNEYPGIGMGLALCKRIIERHGGRIWVESEQGEGSTFCFSIPAKA